MQLASFVFCAITAGFVMSGCSTYTATTPANTTTDDSIFSEFTTDYFSLKIPPQWQVIKAMGPDVPAYISLINNESNSAFNLRVSRSSLSIEDLCQLAAKGVVANRGDIYEGPIVSYGTCKIKAHSPSGHDFEMRMRAYDEGEIAVINYVGDLESIGEILNNLEADEKIMSLFVEPL